MSCVSASCYDSVYGNDPVSLSSLSCLSEQIGRSLVARGWGASLYSIQIAKCSNIFGTIDDYRCLTVALWSATGHLVDAARGRGN